MNIQEIWNDQYQLQQLWHTWPTMSGQERDTLAKELLLHLHEEVGDIQRIMDQSKYHIMKQKRDQDPYMVADAGVDVMKLLIALMLLRGVTPEMFTKAWVDVSGRVRDRWKWEQDELGATEVLLCDLDGVVAMYAEGFREWCARRFHHIPDGKINAPDMEPIKDEFHSSGGFAGLDAVQGSIDILNRWRGASLSRRLVMVTARPYKQYKQVYNDTVSWLRDHGVMYDHILFERDKAEAVRQVQPAKIKAHIEDRGKHALEVAATGVIVYKLPFASPEEQIYHPKIHQVNDWADIAKLLEVLL